MTPTRRTALAVALATVGAAWAGWAWLRTGTALGPNTWHEDPIGPDDLAG